MLRFATIGVGGYGQSHLDPIHKLEEEGTAQLAAVAESNTEFNRETLERLAARKVNLYSDYREMLATEKCVDVVTIATGIPLHAPMTIAALDAGYHVITEKPPAATIQELDAMLEAQHRSGRHCAIGFQMLSGGAFRHLNESIKNGRLGNIHAVIGMGLWKRVDSYYERNNWAGRLKVGDRWVLDGPVLNPLSHILNNLLFLASPTLGEAAMPVPARAELYKAHRIESEDTSCLTAITDGGVRVHTYFTTCAPTGSVAMMQAIGTKGVAVWESQVKLTYKSVGTEADVEALDFTDAEPGTTREIFRNFAAYLQGETDALYYPLAQTRAYQITANAAFESSLCVYPIDPQYVTRQPEDLSVATTITDISTICLGAAAEGKLFSEMGVPWSRVTDWFDVRAYTTFPKQFGMRSS